MSKNLLKLNASAGSGKTYALTNTFVERLFESDIAPCESCRPVKDRHKYNFSELLAITFTNLAANQMKEKVIEKLKQYALREIPCETKEEEEKKAKQAAAMLENIFQQYGALNIRTIDSLLNQIIGLFALELGYAPHFETIFSSRQYAEELYAQLAELSINNEDSEDAGAINYAPVFHELCHNVFQNFGHESFFAKSVLQEKVVKFIEYCIKNNHMLSETELKKLEQNYTFFNQKNEETINALLLALQNLKKKIAEENIAVSQNFKKALEKAEAGDYSSTTLSKENFSAVLLKSNKADYTDASRYYEELKIHIQSLSLFQTLTKDYALCVPVMKIVFFLYQALDIYEKNQQVINAQKMPFLIASLLGDNAKLLQNAFLQQKKQEENLIPAAYCRLGTRLKHILYDEFQDTSLGQWNALKDLSGEALASGGSVFFVGDVKQAIYGWRGGKASLFNDAPEELKPLTAEGVFSDTLQYNWRSAEYIIHWNNSFFENLLDTEKNSALALLFPSFADEKFSDTLLAELKESLLKNYEEVRQKIAEVRLPAAAGKGLVEVHVFQESNNFFDVAALAVLPEMVKNLYKKYNDYSKIAILTVNNKQASCVSQILLEHGIPVVSQGSLGLKEHPVILEVIAFLRFLANPLDDNVFCQVLLSRHILPQSFYGNCPAQKLFDFLVKKRDKACFTAFRDAFPELWQKYFYVLVDGANLLTAYDTLCEVYNRMGIMEQNADSSVYLLRLKELAYLAEERGIVDINAFLTWWDENGEKENAPLPEGLNSVSVLTMHKAKGLEYEAVIIPWHNFRIDVQGDICKLDLPYEGKSYTVYAELKKGYGKAYDRAIAEKISECINLLYVAWTRAKQELHIFIPEKYDSNKNGHFYKFIKEFLAETKEKLGEQIIAANERDGFYFGADYVPAVSEKTLRSLEYALDSPFDEKEKAKAVKYLSDREQKRITAFFADYQVEKKAKKQEGENTACELKIPTEDILHVAKKLSRLLFSRSSGQTAGSSEKTAHYDEKEYSQEHSMDWLPQLRIFRSNLDELRGVRDLSSNKRGTLIHKSLEYLVFSGNIAEDCKRAGFEAMKFLPYGRFLEQNIQANIADNTVQYKKLYAELQEDLKWFASLQEPYGGAALWFNYGYKEHCITDDKGNLFRVDLLVEIPADRQKQYGNVAYLAVDYKTGYLNEELPVPGNKEQIMNYIDLLSKSTGKKAAGLLIYLDKRECCLVEGE